METAIFVIFVIFDIFLIMFFWEKSKRSEMYSILCYSLVVADGYYLYAWDGKDIGVFDSIVYLAIYFIVIVIMLLILNAFIEVAKEQGMKEINKEIEDYERLINKDEKDLIGQEAGRIKYLKKAKEKDKMKYIDFNRK